MKLTDSAITKAAKDPALDRRGRDLVDDACAGLRLRVTPAGARTWALVCRDQFARMRRFALGSHPEMGIAEARKAANALRPQIKQGADPNAEKRRTRAIGQAAREGAGTLQSLIDLYGKQCGADLKSWPESKRRIESVFKPFLGRLLAELRAADFQLHADSYPARQSASAAVRYLRPILKWAAEPGRGYIPAEAAAIKPPATVQRRDRVLSRDELARLLPVLATTGTPYADALRFILLTLTRREEACGARWRDIDLAAGTWTIATTKNGQPHVVPLSRQAVALLAARRPENAAPDALVFSTRSGKPLGNWDREAKAIMVASKTEGWTRHDLRRTGATMLGDMGELPDIIEAALNHVSIRSALAATYNRSRYRPQVAAALQRLADALEGIEAGAAVVVPIRRAGRA